MLAWDAVSIARQQTNAGAMTAIEVDKPVAVPNEGRQTNTGRAYVAGLTTLFVAGFILALAWTVGHLSGVSMFNAVQNAV